MHIKMFAAMAESEDPRKMKPSDPAYWMLLDGVETKPVVHSDTCYICRDPEFAQMGMPLCRACPACGGHVAADDTVCDGCGLDEQGFWTAVTECCRGILPDCFSTGQQGGWTKKPPSAEQLQDAITAYNRERDKLNRVEIEGERKD